MIDRTKTVEPEEQEESFAYALMKFLRELFRMFRMSCKFEEFLEKTGEYFDERIRHKEAHDKVKYAGGKITFTLSGDQVLMSSKLYFLNEAEKWIVQESSNSVDKSRFNDWDKDEDLQRLSRGETVELDINHPDEN